VCPNQSLNPHNRVHRSNSSSTRGRERRACVQRWWSCRSFSSAPSPLSLSLLIASSSYPSTSSSTSTPSPRLCCLLLLLKRYSVGNLFSRLSLVFLFFCSFFVFHGKESNGACKPRDLELHQGMLTCCGGGVCRIRGFSGARSFWFAVVECYRKGVPRVLG